MLAKVSSIAAVAALLETAQACMLASFTYDPCTSAISGTLIDNGIEIGRISPTINNHDSIGTLIQLSPEFSAQGVKAYVHTVESISSSTSTSTSGKKQGYLSHITFHSPSGDSSSCEVTRVFELVREAKNQAWSSAVYGCDDLVGDAWFYELGGWSRWGGEAHPISKGEGGKLRCDSEGLMYDGNQVATGIELASPARRRTTGAARRAEGTAVVEATATPTPATAEETPIVQVEKPVATAFEKREVGEEAAEGLTKLRAGRVTSGAGGVREGVKPTSKHRFGESKAPLRKEAQSLQKRQIFGSTGTLRSSEVRPEDVGFRKRDSEVGEEAAEGLTKLRAGQVIGDIKVGAEAGLHKLRFGEVKKEAEGVEKRQMFGSAGTLRGSGLKSGNVGVANGLAGS